MKPSLEIKPIVLGVLSSLGALVFVLAASAFFQMVQAASTASASLAERPAVGSQAERGNTLFILNCAHCHGADARGDEGPDLHGVATSDRRIASLIKNGINGEMPAFKAKLSDDDVHALIEFLRTLRK